MIRWGSILLLVYFMAACRKEPPIDFEGCGRKFDPEKQAQPWYGWHNIKKDTMYWVPCFNPKNNNELTYVEEIGDDYYLMAFDRSSGAKRQLAMGVAGYSPPSWGINGWVLFQGQDRQIWKVKSNGDSLTQVTHEGKSFYPDWDPDGTLFVSMYDPPGYGFRGFVIRDQFGVITDSLMSGYRAVWSPDGQKLALGGVSYCYVDNPHHTIALTPPKSSDRPSDYAHEWSADSKAIIWVDDNENVYETDISTGESKTLIKADPCVSHSYVSVSGDGKFLLFPEYHEVILDPRSSTPDSVYVSSRLVVYDIEKKKKTVILD